MLATELKDLEQCGIPDRFFFRNAVLLFDRKEKKYLIHLGVVYFHSNL